MKVMLLKDVYKLGRAGDVKKVADGYGRNYLLPQGLATLATPGALKQVDRIRSKADTVRTRLTEELGEVAEKIGELQLAFPVKASETGKLYGSINPAMITEAIEEATEAGIERRQIDSQPIKVLGVHKVAVRLTIDLVPEVTVLVHREGEPQESAFEFEEISEAVGEEIPDYLQAIIDEEAAEEEPEAETSDSDVETSIEEVAEESSEEPQTVDQVVEESSEEPQTVDEVGEVSEED